MPAARQRAWNSVADRGWNEGHGDLPPPARSRPDGPVRDAHPVGPYLDAGREHGDEARRVEGRDDRGAAGSEGSILGVDRRHAGHLGDVARPRHGAIPHPAAEAGRYPGSVSGIAREVMDPPMYSTEPGYR